MKKLVIAITTLVLISTQVNAQEKKRTVEKGEMKIVIIEDDNGEKATFDSIFSIQDREKVEELLKQRGIDFKMDFKGDDIQILGEGDNNFFIKEVIDEESEGTRKMIKVHSSASDIDDKEIKLVIENIGEELNAIKDKIHIDLKKADAIEIETDHKMSEEDIKKLKEELTKGEGKIIMKTIVMEEDENGDVETKVFEFKTDAMVFFISDELKDEMDDLPTEIVEKDLKALQLEELKLFPNPNNGHFNISFDSNEENDFQITVSDVNGRNVYEKNLTNFKGRFNEDFDLSQNDSGMYFFNIVSGEHRETKKIILK